MHMADALVSPAVAATMYVASGASAGTSVVNLRKEDYSKKIPVMGVMGAFVFATQMINFTIPGTGSSGHLCGGMLLTALLGPYAGFLTMISVLLIQCLLFADGGILALGCNVWNMAFYGCFVGAFLVWSPIMKKGFSRGKVIAASIIGCVVSLQLGAFSVTLQTLLSGITELPFSVFVATMQPIHLAIGFVEGLITAAVLVFVYEAKPDLLYRYEGVKDKENSRMSLKGTLVTLAVTTLLIGGGLSLFASEHPDGLEWSMERITGSTELEAVGHAYEVAGGIQESTALLPDYAFANNDTAFGTSFSGIVGSLVVVALCVLTALVIKSTVKKKCLRTRI
ncbi:MAG: energy-coupling factor ABC transporter permease [Lachnospiraceae bacterium]|nr:energy-coupling factor ABC transporter permease [Lachnospiraceae bacterium]